MTQPVRAVLVGAGNRGADSYAPYALEHPEQICFTAVAEPDALRRERFAKQHHIPPENQFASWEALFARPQLGEAALVCTQDWDHTGPALAAMQAGYDVLLEKPMATTVDDCRALVNASEQLGRKLYICHVMRYTEHYGKMYELVQSGVLGEVVDVDHRENVSYWHMAHSFVRGNWRNSLQSSPMILAKCCHDLDMLVWVLGRRCETLSSFGSLMEFRAENAPQGAPDYCLDGCPAADTCLYYAPWVYVDLVPFWRSFEETSEGFNRVAVQNYLKRPGLVNFAANFYPPLRQLEGYRGWPISVVHPDPTAENLLQALKRGPYGRCVYRCDNNVVDHQVVAMQFEGGMTVNLGMHGHSHVEYRTTRIEGTRGRLLAEFGNGGSWIAVDEHKSDRHTRLDTSGPTGTGHGGGDARLMEAFVKALRGDPSAGKTTAREALESHLMAFAAERSRLEGRVIRRSEF